MAEGTAGAGGPRHPARWGLGDRHTGEGQGQGQWPHSDPLPPSEYMAQLEHQLQFYTEAARRLGNEGSRVSLVGFGWALGH